MSDGDWSETTTLTFGMFNSILSVRYSMAL